MILLLPHFCVLNCDRHITVLSEGVLRGQRPVSFQQKCQDVGSFQVSQRKRAVAKQDSAKTSRCLLSQLRTRRTLTMAVRHTQGRAALWVGPTTERVEPGWSEVTTACGTQLHSVAISALEAMSFLRGTRRLQEKVMGPCASSAALLSCWSKQAHGQAEL